MLYLLKHRLSARHYKSSVIPPGDQTNNSSPSLPVHSTYRVTSNLHIQMLHFPLGHRLLSYASVSCIIYTHITYYYHTHFIPFPSSVFHVFYILRNTKFHIFCTSYQYFVHRLKIFTYHHFIEA